VEWLKSRSVECSRRRPVASLASRESGMATAEDGLDMVEGPFFDAEMDAAPVGEQAQDRQFRLHCR
jgi:hypothetical protein